MSSTQATTRLPGHLNLLDRDLIQQCVREALASRGV